MASHRATRWAVLALLLLGLALHLTGLSARSLNTDEVYIPLRAQIGNLLAAVVDDVHPPLYPLLLGAFVKLYLPEWSWRLFSVLCWLGAALTAFAIGRRLGNDALGLAAMALLLCSPQGVMLSRLVRSYALAALLGGLTVWLFLRLREQATASAGLTFALVAAAGCYTFYYNLALLAALLLTTLALRLLESRREPIPLWPTLLAGVLFLPWLPLLWRQGLGGGAGGWITWSAAPLRILRRFTQVLAAAGGIDGVEPSIRAVAPALAGIGATLLTLFFLIAGTVVLIRRRENDSALPAVTALVVAATALLALVVHYVFGVFVAVHYFVVLAAATAPLLVALLVVDRGKLGGLLFGLLIVANLLFVPQAAKQGDEPLREAAHWIDQHIDDDDVVIGVAWFAADGYRWYGRGRETIGFPVDLYSEENVTRAAAAIARPVDAVVLRTRLGDVDRVALLLSHETWRGADRGVELAKRTLQSEGFDPVKENAWPFGEAPTVRTEIWQRTRPRSPFAPMP